VDGTSAEVHKRVLRFAQDDDLFLGGSDQTKGDGNGKSTRNLNRNRKSKSNSKSILIERGPKRSSVWGW